jgi:Zn-finger nucleic acid-binding protein
MTSVLTPIGGPGGPICAAGRRASPRGTFSGRRAGGRRVPRGTSGAQVPVRSDVRQPSSARSPNRALPGSNRTACVAAVTSLSPTPGAAMQGSLGRCPSTSRVKDASTATRPTLHWYRRCMECPCDGKTMVIKNLVGVEYNFCPDCNGVWLSEESFERLQQRLQTRSFILGTPSPRRWTWRRRKDSDLDRLLGEYNPLRDDPGRHSS